MPWYAWVAVTSLAFCLGFVVGGLLSGDDGDDWAPRG